MTPASPFLFLLGLNFGGCASDEVGWEEIKDAEGMTWLECDRLGIVTPVMDRSTGVLVPADRPPGKTLLEEETDIVLEPRTIPGRIDAGLIIVFSTCRRLLAISWRPVEARQ